MNSLPYLIAEIGLNHEGSLACAKRMIEEIAEAGGHAAKFQAIFPDTLCARRSPTYFYQAGDVARTQWEFFHRTPALQRHDFVTLATVCRRAGIDFLCTPFDVESVTWLDPLVPRFKIASADITHYPLLEAVARTGKPVLLSTGATTVEEIGIALAHLRDAESVTLLHCVLAYPTALPDAQLGMITALRCHELGDPPVGYSDHTLFNLDVLTTAWLFGASVIEKHYTFDKTMPGNDHYHAMDKHDLTELVGKLHLLRQIIGDSQKVVFPAEESARIHARRSYHARLALRAGDTLRMNDFTLKRPGTGLGPADPPPWGRRLQQSCAEDEVLTLAHFA